VSSVEQSFDDRFDDCSTEDEDVRKVSVLTEDGTDESRSANVLPAVVSASILVSYDWRKTARKEVRTRHMKTRWKVHRRLEA